MDHGEELVKYLVGHAMEFCEEDLSLFFQFVDKSLPKLMDTLLKQEFARLSYTEAIEVLKKSNKTVDYFVIGIQQQSNTIELFDIAKSKHVDYIINYDCESSCDKITSLQKKLIPFIAKNDYLYITIDLDGFSSAYASGVSAPSPLGFTPYFVFEILRFLFNSNKVISCDIAELNPTYDQDNITVNLDAKLVDFMAMNS